MFNNGQKNAELKHEIAFRVIISNLDAIKEE